MRPDEWTMTRVNDHGADPVQPAVVCRGVTKEFGKGDNRTRVLRGVDLEVRYGEITLLVGQSGCGKTTLLSVMAGLLDPTAGEVEALGRNRAASGANERIHF